MTHLIQGIIIEVWQSLSKSRSEKVWIIVTTIAPTKSRFQQELEQSVSRKLISSLLLGCLLFCIAIAAVNALNQNARREDHLESVASTFHEVYNNTSAFLLDSGHTELFLSELRNDQDNLRYLISHYNVSALVEIQLILTDSKERFGSRPFGGRDESPPAGI